MADQDQDMIAFLVGKIEALHMANAGVRDESDTTSQGLSVIGERALMKYGKDPTRFSKT